MREVILHVYDVSNGGSEKTDNTSLRIFKDRIGLGGVFHSAVQLRQAKTKIVTASKVAYRFIASLASNSNSSATPESPGNSNRSSPRFQGTVYICALEVRIGRHL
ncbi:hypothetical protein COCNU_07G008160 [Cocos nucifera]|uniref:Uncharacterized protein n=1 Tax=Cocos nucifera TaxID=13894 RepID=A0A8K0IFU8_COCNU|nr:hypothetical protein COCNU_07G008160 [Cocos nucifera]